MISFRNLLLSSDSPFQHVLPLLQILQDKIVEFLVVLDCRNYRILGLLGIQIVIHVPILLEHPLKARARYDGFIKSDEDLFKRSEVGLSHIILGAVGFNDLDHALVEVPVLL